MMTIVEKLLSVVFPRRCISCGSFGRYICEKCIPGIKSVTVTICPMCTKPSPFGLTHPKCKTRYSLDGLASFFRYTGSIKKAIKMVKYQRVKDIVPALSLMVFNKLYSNSHSYNLSVIRFIEMNKPFVIPIPLHSRRKRERWFNQSELIAHELGSLLNLEVKSELINRTRYTSAQAGLYKDDRTKNIKNAFQINKENRDQISGTSVILLDDVWTTGATMREAGNILKRAGVRNIWGMTLAR